MVRSLALVSLQPPVNRTPLLTGLACRGTLQCAACVTRASPRRGCSKSAPCGSSIAEAGCLATTGIHAACEYSATCACAARPAPVHSPLCKQEAVWLRRFDPPCTMLRDITRQCPALCRVVLISGVIPQ